VVGPASRWGFTLAEVLITLGIIGVVAALTIPNLIANYQKQQTVARLKKAYSEIFQAIKLSEIEDGSALGRWDISVAGVNWLDANTEFLDYLGKSIKFIKTCTPTSDECWKMPDKDLTTDKVFADRRKPYFVSAVTASGYSIYCWVGGDLNNGHTHIFIDVDGPDKGKQVLGKDIFRAFYSFQTNNFDIGTGENETRDDLLQKCKDADQCLRLIMYDGWTIAPDYPHRL